MDSWGPLLIRQGIFHKANVPNNDILPRYLSRDTTLPAQNSGRVKFLHVVLQKQKNKMSVIFTKYQLLQLCYTEIHHYSQNNFQLYSKSSCMKEVKCACYLSKKYISLKLMQCQSAALQKGKTTKGEK